MTIDAELLLNELRRKERCFAAAIFWRDVREVGVALLTIPAWLYLGIASSLPWTWYLAIPALLWIAGFLLVDRMRHRRHPLEMGETLRQRVESSLAQVTHQVWLLRNVFWWYLLPIALSITAFFADVSCRSRLGGWWVALSFAGAVALEVVVLGALYWVNQHAVASELEPRRQELEALRASLEDAPPPCG